MTESPGASPGFEGMHTMQRRFWSAPALFLSAIGLASLCATTAQADTPPVGAMTLQQCLDIAFERQPSLAAARASLASAQSGQQALNNLGLLARVAAPDLPV